VTKNRFILFQLGLTLVLAVASWLLIDGWLPAPSLTFVFVALGISGAASIAAFIITFNGLQKAIRSFSTYLIGGMVAKLLIGIFSISIVALRFRDFAEVFVLSYFFFYLVFTSFEVFALMRNLRPNLKKAKRDSNEEDAVK